MKEFPRKFLSLRDKNGGGRRAKSVPPVPGTAHGNKPRQMNANAFMSIFKTDHFRQNSKDESEKEKEAAKVAEVTQLLDEMNITNISPDHIVDILATKYADNDPKKATDFIDMEQKAASGVIVPYDPSVDMVGAENRGNVTCYLDALLFSMFAKLDAFECMLKNEFPDEDNRSKLVTLLRLWVNMLRSGKLVYTDMTSLIQEALAECGWSDARMLEQQDTSEAFAFITETLQLPLLSLQVDLFHQGKGDKDDHKVVYERLLNLAVPPDADGKGIKLEDCLEEYFNAQVDVQRDSEEAKKLTYDDRSRSETPKLVHRDTIRLITEELGESSTPLMASPIAPSPSAQTPTQENGLVFPSPTTIIHNAEEKSEEDKKDEPRAPEEAAEERPATRGRSTSVIQRVLIDERGRPSTPDNVTMLRKAMRKGSTVVKAVTIPAWQFFRLIPWHAVTSNEPRTNSDVAMNFDQRPVVGICLKRYAMTESGLPKRHNTFIDIPDSLRLPHFMLADDPKLEDDPNLLNTEYKLVLQSVICHRGDSLQSGHYIAFARVAPKLLTDNRRHAFDPPPDYEEAQWVRFDDLNLESRVTYIDDIKQSLKEEMPYLLFYQVLPMRDGPAPSVEETDTEPPSYNDSRISIELPPTPARVDSNQASRSSHEGYFGNNAVADGTQLLSSKPPSIRLSFESDRQPRRSGEGLEPPSSFGDSRRPSANWADSPSVSPSPSSPAITPVEESTAQRMARAASRFAKVNRSRPTSQSGEGRKSLTMSRWGGLMRPSKEALSEYNNGSLTNSISSTMPLASESSKEKDASDSPAQTEGEHHQSHHGHKHGHRRIRSKDKVKNKSSSALQPERECVVM